MHGLLLQINEIGANVKDTLNSVTSNGPVEAQPTEETLSFFELAMKGGWVMLPLILFSIIAIYIFIERYITISKAAKEDKNFMNHIRDFIHDGRIDSAKSLCKTADTPIGRMIDKGISRLGKPLNDVNAAIENTGNLEVSKLEKGVATLATIAGASPMIGFLGTVIGMVRAFFDMSKAGNNIDISLLSTGIYQAMITTVAGLIVGIIGYICYNILVARIEKVVFKLGARATEFMDLLNEPA